MAEQETVSIITARGAILKLDVIDLLISDLPLQTPPLCTVLMLLLRVTALALTSDGGTKTVSVLGH